MVGRGPLLPLSSLKFSSPLFFLQVVCLFCFLFWSRPGGSVNRHISHPHMLIYLILPLLLPAFYIWSLYYTNYLINLPAASVFKTSSLRPLVYYTHFFS